ncbi:MAG TPA: RNA-binding transcriptional accessory protein [Bacteroidetes bacterium]|nr:RNA-binding transcriptional accessory protein [Bacteroidota bacterium]
MTENQNSIETNKYRCTEPDRMIEIIAGELHLRPVQVKNTIELLDDESTVPFIARYRKEVTGKLDEEQIRLIQSHINYLRNLENRKQTVLKTIDEQEKLTDELRRRICRSLKMQEVEDLYLPYKPKRKTRGTVAKAKGLELLAMLIREQQTTEGTPEEHAESFIDEDKGVTTAAEALQGARDIVAEMISENADIRQIVREFSYHRGQLVSEAKDEKVRSPFEMYYEYKEAVKQIRPHRILAMNRGEKEGMLRVSIDLEKDRLIKLLNDRIITNHLSVFIDHLEESVLDSYERLISPSIEREIRNEATEKAEHHAIKIFAENLRNLLLQASIKNKRIMGIDPGFRTGCKVAVIDETGKYIEGATIYPHPPQKDRQGARRTIVDLANKHFVDIVAIGNGTASRETEQLVAELIQEKLPDLVYAIVSEAGASVYSASPLAKEEFPDLEASMRGNISIARRLLDPLSELVKIDPKAIGVGLYQHDVNQRNLSEALDTVVESVVNFVGVDLNTASWALLKYVSGLNSRLAKNITAYRDEHGQFKNRKQLHDVKGMGPKAFEQCAGFLRIPESDNLFDNTAIHPESYPAAQKLLQELNLEIELVRTKGGLIRERSHEKKQSLTDLANSIAVGVPTLEDIIDNLEKPGRDPRADMPKPILRRDVMKMEDLREGMLLKGTVRNVVDFGAFVDIGVKQDGLVHRSEMGKRVMSPMEVVSVGDIIEVKVLKVDSERGRIALSMNLN